MMRLGMFLTTLIGLAGASHISSAATSSSTDATWAAYGQLENGQLSCAGATIPMPEWAWPTTGQVEIKGNTLTFTTASRAPNSSFTVDLKGLQPDGSGRIVAKDNKNRTFYLTLDPGSGPRPFYLTYSYNACRRVYTPTT
jgi:type II secretory pathway pseudopilin PulG